MLRHISHGLQHLLASFNVGNGHEELFQILPCIHAFVECFFQTAFPLMVFFFFWLTGLVFPICTPSLTMIKKRMAGSFPVIFLLSLPLISAIVLSRHSAFFFSSCHHSLLVNLLVNLLLVSVQRDQSRFGFGNSKSHSVIPVKLPYWSTTIYRAKNEKKQSLRFAPSPILMASLCRSCAVSTKVLPQTTTYIVLG